jgi:predicted transcriptional regulator
MLPRWIGAAQPFAAAGDQIARSASWCAALAKRSWNSTENVTSHSLFDIINSKETAEGDEKQTKSERKYLRQILDVKENQPELFARILGLPRIARSTRDHAPELPSAEHPESHPLALRPAVITYFRQGRLDKFFRSHAATDRAQELDFFTTAETLETTAVRKTRPDRSRTVLPLADKNKTGFTSAATSPANTSSPSRKSGRRMNPPPSGNSSFPPTCLDQAFVMVYNNGMPTMTHRTTFALDEATAQRLKRLASRWKVSQAEVVRRSVEQAEQHLTTSPSDIERRLETARQLRASLRERKVDVTAWIATARDSRR